MAGSSRPPEVTSRARGLMAAVAGVWGVQVVTAVAQFGYAIVASRVLAASSFGAYAAALAIAQVGSLVATLGLGDAVARRLEEDEAADRSAVSWGVLGGLATAVLLWLLAGWLSAIWDSPDSVPMIRAFAVSMLWLPLATIGKAVLRRREQFRVYNMVLGGSGLLAVCLSVVILLTWRQTWTLAAFPLLSGAITAVAVAVALRGAIVPNWSFRRGWEDLRFGVKSIGASSLLILANLLPLWGLSRFAGQTTLGAWNRAQTVGRLPLEVSTYATMNVIYPVFRHTRVGDAQHRRIWSDAFSSTAWVFLPPALVMTPALPELVTLLLGPGWAEASAMIPFVWVATVAFCLSQILGGAMQATNSFRGLYVPQVTLLAILAAGVAWTATTGSWLGVAISSVIGFWGAHFVQIALAATRGFITGRRVLQWYLLAGLASGFLLGCSQAVEAVAGSAATRVLVPAVLAAGFLAVTVRYWRTIPPLRSSFTAGRR